MDLSRPLPRLSLRHVGHKFLSIAVGQTLVDGEVHVVRQKMDASVGVAEVGDFTAEKPNQK